MSKLNRFLDSLSQKRIIIYLCAATPLSVAIGMFTHKMFLPLANALFLYPVFLKFVRERERVRNIINMLAWAFLMSVCVISATVSFPGPVEEKIINASAYKKEMFEWVKTGVGAEGDIRLFLPIHVTHYSLFLILSAASGGFISLIMGAALLNYMNFYVGSLFYHATDPATILIFGWHIWAVVRVVGFIVAAVILAEVLGGRLFAYKLDKRALIRYLSASFALILCDIILKFSLAPYWQKTLNSVIAF